MTRTKKHYQADLQQNRAFNPFSEQSMEMIYFMGNMEYFDICDSQHTMPKLYGILAERYCVLHMRNMLNTFTVRKLDRDRCDVLSIPNRVIDKGPWHGRRHGNTERQRIYHQAHVSSNKAKKKVYKSIRDRFLRCSIYQRHRAILLILRMRRGSCTRRFRPQG